MQKYFYSNDSEYCQKDRGNQKLMKDFQLSMAYVIFQLYTIRLHWHFIVKITWIKKLNPQNLIIFIKNMTFVKILACYGKMWSSEYKPNTIVTYTKIYALNSQF